MSARRSTEKRLEDLPLPQGPIADKGPICTSEQFRLACEIASKDPASGAGRMERLAAASAGGDVQHELDNMVELAKLCIQGLCGAIGTRRSLRAAAARLLDRVLERDGGHLKALCMKGEMLIPRHLYGFSGSNSNPPLDILEEALSLFCKASQGGSNEGTFLKGRYMVSMASNYRQSWEGEGRLLVEEAAAKGSARALVFLAQRLEFDTGREPISLFGKAIPDSKDEREKIVFDLYKKAADMGNGDALNDVGSCYATAFGSLEHDFDAAAMYYVKAIEAGSLHAFDNLGTHYEYGMSGVSPERIDLEKAVHYYKMGAKMRCSKCALNLANSYEDGVGTDGGLEIVQKDPLMAEKYLKYAIAIANDEDDTSAASEALKLLVALLITRIKTNPPDDQSVHNAMRELKSWLPKVMLKTTITNTDKFILKAVKDNDHSGQLTDYLGDGNAQKVFAVASKLIDDINSIGKINPTHSQLLKHMFGQFANDAAIVAIDGRSPKRRRSSK